MSTLIGHAEPVLNLRLTTLGVREQGWTIFQQETGLRLAIPRKPRIQHAKKVLGLIRTDIKIAFCIIDFHSDPIGCQRPGGPHFGQ